MYAAYLRKNMRAKKLEEEIFDGNADLASESAALIHDNKTRWRVFCQRVNPLIPEKRGNEGEKSEINRT